MRSSTPNSSATGSPDRGVRHCHAADKYGADGYVLSRAIIPSQDLDPAGAVVRLQVVEGYVDQVDSRRCWRNTAISFPSTRRRSSPSGRPTCSPSSATCCWLATCQAGWEPLALDDPPGRGHARGRGGREIARPARPLGQSRQQGARALPIPGQREHQECLAHPRRLHRHRCRLVSNQGAQIRRWQLPPGPQQRGLSAYVFGAYGWGGPGTFELESIDYRTRARSSKPA